MNKTYNYINIREVLNRILRHPLLQEVSLEQAIQYTVDFIATFGMPAMYNDKEEVLHIKDYRAILPCDVVSINQIKECSTGICLRSMTDTFYTKESYDRQEFTFKVQGNIIFTSFKEGDVLISYKSMPVTEDNIPMIIDNPIFLKTLEAYIKKEIFTIYFDMGKIPHAVYQEAQRNYAWLVGQLRSEFTIPSLSEMESIKNNWCSLLQRNNAFDASFKSLGNREYLKQH